MAVREVTEERVVVQQVDTLLHTAIARAASDIHLEPTAEHLRIRFRLDGVLYNQKAVEKMHMQQVLARLKVLARMNIAERRIPQDGKFTITYRDQPVDLRVSTFPSLYGEKIVVRILDRSTNAIELNQLGFSSAMLCTFEKLIRKSNGFFLVTGPTGSGKTTTLYAALAALNSPEKNILTLEDPVEYNVPGITQGYIHPDAGFTFEKGIRALLRQDPDVLMVGEIRDKQTARVAIEAALTGHLVLSTLHTNDAPSAVMRLMDMGIEPFLINASLTGILAQRLVRVICTACRTEQDPTTHEEQLLKQYNIILSKVYKGTGCKQCDFLGYKGRTGIFELLEVSNTLRSRIVQQPVFDAIYTQALHDGMCTLLNDGAQKVRDGIITLQELMRVLA